MKVVIAGGSGFLGSSLATSLRIDGHDVKILTRRPRAGVPDDVAWGDLGVIEDADAVVNLAGDPLDGARWTGARKASILRSRIEATERLVKAIGGGAQRPSVFVSASAIGYYGARGAEELTEESPAGSDFLSEVCVAWEGAAMAAAWTTRVVILRTGLVLDRNAGALPKLALPFRFFAGGRVGSGAQYWSWIHRLDWTRMVRWAIDTPDVTGPLNVTAPQPVTNRDFARALGRTLHRPAIAPAPALALRLMLGEMADAMILSGQRAVPARALAKGFAFEYTDLETALDQIYE